MCSTTAVPDPMRFAMPTKVMDFVSVPGTIARWVARNNAPQPLSAFWTSPAHVATSRHLGMMLPWAVHHRQRRTQLAGCRRGAQEQTDANQALDASR